MSRVSVRLVDWEVHLPTRSVADVTYLCGDQHLPDYCWRRNSLCVVMYPVANLRSVLLSLASDHASETSGPCLSVFSRVWPGKSLQASALTFSFGHFCIDFWPLTMKRPGFGPVKVTVPSLTSWSACSFPLNPLCPDTVRLKVSTLRIY